MAKFIQCITLLLLTSPLCFGQEKDDDESPTPEQSGTDQLTQLIKLLQPTPQQPPKQQPQQQPGKQQKPQKPPQKFPQQPQQPPQPQSQQQRPQQQQQLPWMSNWAQKQQQWQEFFKRWPQALKRYILLQQLWQSQRGAQQASPNNVANTPWKNPSAQDLLRSLVLLDNA